VLRRHWCEAARSRCCLCFKVALKISSSLSLSFSCSQSRALFLIRHRVCARSPARELS
jgi:hypothetical protein